MAVDGCAGLRRLPAPARLGDGGWCRMEGGAGFTGSTGPTKETNSLEDAGFFGSHPSSNQASGRGLAWFGSDEQQATSLPPSRTKLTAPRGSGRIWGGGHLER
jgi:hypothetical protein